jgi:hypothetical protein
VHRVFTRIRSGATVVVSGGSALGSTLPSKVVVRRRWFLGTIC